MDRWHLVSDSASGSGSAAAASASASGSGGHDDEVPDGLFGSDADQWAFLRDEEALPMAEKFNDALIFLIDASEMMQGPADEEALKEEEDEGYVRVKGEGSSIDSASGGGGHRPSSHDGSSSSSDSTSAAAAAASSRRLYSESTQFQMVLRVVLRAIRKKIINTPDDYVGVVFFGARESQNPQGKRHVFIHTPLQRLSAAAIRQLDTLLEPEVFDETVGSLSEREIAQGKVEMDQILWVCSSMLTDAQLNNCTKRILLITNNDTPFNAHDPLSRVRAVQKGKDLRDLEIAVDLIAVGKRPAADGKVKPFNPLLFYKDILLFDEDDPVDSMAALFKRKWSDLCEQMFRKVMKKRALGSVPLQIGPGVKIGVKLYCMIRETKKESAVFLDRETNEKLATQTRYLDKATGAVLKPYEMQKYYPYGGVKVVFGDDELKQLKSIDDPGLVLMGFKPYDALRVWHNLKNPYFVYPDDGQFSDSSKAFKALLLAMSELKQYAVCRLIYRRGSIPRLVALLPQLAKLDPDDGEVLQPPGFNLVFLPYADDIRRLRFEPTPIAPDALVQSAKKVVAKLSVRSLPRMANPALQRHYRIIQAIALAEDPPAEDEFEDNLQPDREGMAKYQGLIDQWVGEARELGQAAMAEAEPPARKRRAAADGEEGEEKRPKKEEPDYNSIDWKQMLENDTLKKLTVPTLKVYLRHHKLPLGGAKAELLERVTASLCQ